MKLRSKTHTAAAYDYWQRVATFLDIWLKTENDREVWTHTNQKFISCTVDKAKDPEMRRKLWSLLDRKGD